MAYQSKEYSLGQLKALPSVEDCFASPAVSIAASNSDVTKTHGSGDSAKNEKSSRKASGGSDASHARDGG